MRDYTLSQFELLSVPHSLESPAHMTSTVPREVHRLELLTSVEQEVDADVQIWIYGRKSRRMAVNTNLRYLSEMKAHRFV